jgi:hypothetical protein
MSSYKRNSCFFCTANNCGAYIYERQSFWYGKRWCAQGSLNKYCYNLLHFVFGIEILNGDNSIHVECVLNYKINVFLFLRCVIPVVSGTIIQKIYSVYVYILRQNTTISIFRLNKYMFRPYMWAIFRLFMGTCGRITERCLVGVWGTRSRLSNTGSYSRG